MASNSDSGALLLREGNAGPAENADTWIPHLVRLRSHSDLQKLAVPYLRSPPVRRPEQPWEVAKT